MKLESLKNLSGTQIVVIILIFLVSLLFAMIVSGDFFETTIKVEKISSILWAIAFLLGIILTVYDKKFMKDRNSTELGAVLLIVFVIICLVIPFAGGMVVIHDGSDGPRENGYIVHRYTDEPIRGITECEIIRPWHQAIHFPNYLKKTKYFKGDEYEIKITLKYHDIRLTAEHREDASRTVYGIIDAIDYAFDNKINLHSDVSVGDAMRFIRIMAEENMQIAATSYLKRKNFDFIEVTQVEIKPLVEFEVPTFD